MKLALLLFVCLASAVAQRFTSLQGFDSNGNLTSRLTSVDLRLFESTGQTRTILSPGGIYFRNSAGNQRAYMVAAGSASFGGGIVLSNSDASDKMVVDTADNSPIQTSGGIQPFTDTTGTVGTGTKRFGSGYFSSNVFVGNGASGQNTTLNDSQVTMYDSSFVAKMVLNRSSGLRFDDVAAAVEITPGTSASAVINRSVVSLSRSCGAVITMSASGSGGSLTTSDGSCASSINTINQTGINTTAGYAVGGTTVINSSRDGSFRNLSFTGLGPYSAGTGISISGATISANLAGGFHSCGVDRLALVQLTATGTLNATCSVSVNTVSASSPISASTIAGAVTVSCATCFTSGDATSAFSDHLTAYHVGGTSASCGAGEAVKSVTVSTSGVPSVSCAVP